MATAESFPLLWETAVKKFEEEHQCNLADIVQNAASGGPEDILQQANMEFFQFREKGEKLRNRLKPFADTICSISTALGHGMKLVFQPAELITAGIVVLIKTCQRVGENYDAVADLLTELHFLLERIREYAGFDLSQQVEILIVDSLAETLTVIRIATRVTAQGRHGAFVRTLFHKDKKIQQALVKLDQLSKREGHSINLATLTSTKEILKEMQDGIKFNKDHSDTLQSVLKKISTIADEVTGIETHAQKSLNILEELRQLSSPIVGAIRQQQLEKIKPKYEFQAEHDPCLEGTRPDILSIVRDWTEDVDAPNVFWLYGHPGTGKSAIATTIRHDLARQRRLGASCFFRREDTDFHKPRDVVLSIASDLVCKHDFIGTSVIKKLQEGKLDVKDASPSQLFESLVVEPLQEVASGFNDAIVVVIDALDEFGGTDHYNDPQYILLNILLPRWKHLPSRFKLFITSRDQGYLPNHLKVDLNRIQSLEVGEAATVQSHKDIRLYFEVKLSLTGQRGGQVAWTPSAADLETLTTSASGLFIWASTVVNLVGRRRVQFDRIVTQVRNGSLVGSTPLAGLERLYQTILETVSRNWDMQTLATVCGAIITARVPLSCSTLSSLLQLDERDTDDIVSHLRPVLDSSLGLRFVHKSFVDYMSSDRCPEQYRYIVGVQEQNLLDACFSVMERELHFNMGSMQSSYHFNKRIPDLKRRMSEPTKYGCMFWGSHLEQVGEMIKETEAAVSRFFERFFLFWLEVMSVMECTGGAIRSLAILRRSLGAFRKGLVRQVQDADLFLRAFTVPISQSYPHIYLSALPFSPKTSLVRIQYARHYSSSIEVLSGSDIHWSSQLGILRGHNETVTSVTFSPDGKWIISGSSGGTIRIWDAATHQPIGDLLRGHNGSVTSVVVSPNGTQIASCSDDEAICLWDVVTQQLIGDPLRGHESRIRAIAFSPDGTKIVSGSDDKMIRLWDVATHHLIGHPLRGHEGLVNSVAFSPDGTQLVSASTDQKIYLWNVSKHEPIGEPLLGHRSSVRSVAFSPDGTQIASASNDNTICLWEVATHQLIGYPFLGHTSSIRSVAFSPDGKLLVSASNDETIRLWDVDSQWPIGGPLRRHENWVRSVAFSPDGKQIVSGSNDLTIRLWEVATHQPIGDPPRGHEDRIRSVAFSPDGKQVVSASDDKTIQLWDVATQQPIGDPLRAHKGPVRSLAFSPDGKQLVSASNDRTIRISDVASQQPIGHPLRGHESWVRSVAFSPDGKQIVSGSNDLTIRLWTAATHQPIGDPLRGHKNSIRSVAFSPDGKLIISASNDNTIRLWDVSKKEPIGEPLRGHSSSVRSVAFSPDGTQIVSASNDNTIRLWDVSKHEPIGGPFLEHEGWVRSVAFSHDGKWIVSTSDDKTIRLWDAATHQPIGYPFRGHEDWVRSAVFSPNGKQIVSASHDKTIRLWDFKAALTLGNLPPGPEGTHKYFRTAGSDLTYLLLGDGWVLNSLTLERLFWIPHHLHLYIQCPGMIGVLGKRNIVTLDLALFHHGESWTRCREDPGEEQSGLLG